MNRVGLHFFSMVDLYNISGVCHLFIFCLSLIKVNCLSRIWLTCEGQTGDTGAGERHHCIYSQSGGCVNRWTAHKACCAGHLEDRHSIRIKLITKTITLSH